jgi:hypothetical protein
VDSVDSDSLTRSRNGYGPAGGDPLVEDALKTGETVVRVDPRYFRPTEVGSLIGDASKARDRLGWSPTVRFEELVQEMVREDLASAQRDELCRAEGFSVLDHRESRGLGALWGRGWCPSPILATHFSSTIGG